MHPDTSGTLAPAAGLLKPAMYQQEEVGGRGAFRGAPVVTFYLK